MAISLRNYLLLGTVAAAIGLMLPAAPVNAEIPVFRPLVSLKGWQPRKPDLTGIVVDEAAAIVLGKALFWDMQAGSDGVACASCHFRSGADPRTVNQTSPGLNERSVDFPSGDTVFDPTASGAAGGPNYALVPEDFPLFQPDDGTGVHDPDAHPVSAAEVLFSTNDTISSQGTFGSPFDRITSRHKDPWGFDDPSIYSNPTQYEKFLRQRRNDLCGTPEASSFSTANGGLVHTFQDRFHVDGFHPEQLATRKVEPRNTPTVINAVFFPRIFRDGRANNIFNGVDPFGDRNTRARVVVSTIDGPGLARLRLADSGLASQAVGPVLSDFEMSCSGRRFVDVGRKLLRAKPLVGQEVSFNDSVLGPYADPSGRGLEISYSSLVRLAFDPKYWRLRGKGRIDDTGPEPVLVRDKRGHTQMELNWSMFWGIAIQLYEATLISDDSPFDRFAGCVDPVGAASVPPFSTCPGGVDTPGDPNAITAAGFDAAQVLRGKAIFENIFPPGDPLNPGDPTQPLPNNDLPAGLCAACHNGPFFSGAAFIANPAVPHPNPFALENLLVLAPGGVAERMVVADAPVLDPIVEAAFFETLFGPAPAIEVAGLNDATMRAIENLTRAPFDPVPPDDVADIAPFSFDPALYDIGFYNISVTPTADDFGIGGTGPGGALSFSRQLVSGVFVDGVEAFGHPAGFTGELINPCTFDIMLGNFTRPDPITGLVAQPIVGEIGDLPAPGGPFPANSLPFQPCDPLNPPPAPVDAFVNHRVAVDGAFKTPDLRLVGLTAPFFHNGGYADLRSVVDFYSRGGNFLGGVDGAPGSTDSTATGSPAKSNLDPEIVFLGLVPADREAIVAFLLTLTDERVACERAPFDHPQLVVAEGHVSTDRLHNGKADDVSVVIPAVGADGLASCFPNSGNLFVQ